MGEWNVVVYKKNECFPAHAFRWLYLVCRPPRKARAPLQGFKGRKVELADDGGVGLDCPGLKVWLPANPEVPVQKQPQEDLVGLKFLKIYILWE